MPRTSSTAVQGIIEVDEDADLTPFIETANALVTEVCVPAGYDAARLELIERWLAAHFYAVLAPRAIVEQVGSAGGGVREQYESKVDLGLSITRYGQQAMMLDTTGGLAALNQATIKGTARGIRAVYLGKDADDMLEYEEDP